MSLSRFLLLAILLLVACGPGADLSTPIARSGADVTENDGRDAPDPTATAALQESTAPKPLDSTISAPSSAEPSASKDAAPINRRVEIGVIDKYPVLLPFDGIRPVYNPEFVAAEKAELHEDSLVLGIALGDEAKAYPISVLRFREMVNDELDGIPTLVTW